MSTSHLLAQLTQLSDSLKQTNTLITRLAKLPFSPSSEPVDISDINTVRLELAQDIHDALKQLEEDLELLTQETEDLNPSQALPSHRRRESKTGEKERERARVSAQLTRLSEDLRNSRGRFRSAQLSAKRASEAAKAKERELVFASLRTEPVQNTTDSNNTIPRDLFANRSSLKQKHNPLSKDETLAATSTDITTALRRTHALLSTELSRSRFAQETFDQSTAALADLGEKYSSLDDILSTSRNLLGTLVSSQKSDTWYLETAFYLLLATLAWLFFRRILFGPFVRLPLFLYHCAIFAFRWGVLKPLWGLALLTGVVTTSPAASNTALAYSHGLPSTATRAPLIVHNSAKSGPPKIAMADRERIEKQGGIPAGAGGAGAKIGKDGEAGKSAREAEKRMSERIGEMHERSERAAKEAAGAEEADVQRRGDGTVLEERGDRPRNPKKKVFEDDGGEGTGEERRRVGKRDEL
ncbi:Protein transport protein sec20 [Elasticomyces elasticus]|nr:Protein transport protein sec20 [Elasticomyces elasticus]KAK3667531.1 Protein transport protein sec20 [Elasticomyces elasticus]KAK4927990.1 Protein transport protein sec20 [Elasticomyces elasticus]KAK5762428.1 Protein transport protein sec20 [Elasticomyces elasticus]